MAAFIFQYINQHLVEAILAFLFALSELLAMIPSIASNSIFQLIVGGLKKLKDLLFPGPA